jgi:hypothetical protein
MENVTYRYFKLLLLVVFLLSTYYLIIYKDKYERIANFTFFYSSVNVSQIFKIFRAKTSISNFTTTINDNFTTATIMTTMINRTIITTTTASTSTTIDPAKILVERTPSPSQLRVNLSNTSLAVFVFHTRHFVLADLQLYLIRKLAINLVGVEIFLDGPASTEMRQVADKHKAGLYSLSENMLTRPGSPSDRNADVVNWALATKAKSYLKNGTAILLLDGDVFPLSHFDADTLLNSRDIVCRKHPATYSRFCWIGFICLSPQVYSTLDDFSVSVVVRRGEWHDAGGGTIEYFVKYQNSPFSWMKETILLNNDTELFWGAVDIDIAWIQKNFNRCDKCGPEIFFSPFNTSDAVFYHMISGASEWRFRNQVARRQSLYDSIMKSPYGSTDKFSIAELSASVRKIQKMSLIPFHGDLTCAKICQG